MLVHTTLLFTFINYSASLKMISTDPEATLPARIGQAESSELFIGSTGELYSLCSVSVLQVPQLSGLRALQRPHLPGRQLHPGQLRGAAL